MTHTEASTIAVNSGSEQLWEHFPHVADIGIRGYGKSLEQAFEHIAVAMIAVICDPATIKPLIPFSIECDAPDRELLLTEWLNALIFEMATRKLLFGRFQVRIQGTHLQAKAWAENLNRVRHRPVVEVKGATYTELLVTRQQNGVWLAQCVIDV